jgi:hypothetical protein
MVGLVNDNKLEVVGGELGNAGGSLPAEGRDAGHDDIGVLVGDTRPGLNVNDEPRVDVRDALRRLFQQLLAVRKD